MLPLNAEAILFDLGQLL